MGWDVPKSFELNSWSKKLIVVRVRSLISRKSKLKDEMWEKIDFSPRKQVDGHTIYAEPIDF